MRENGHGGLRKNFPSQIYVSKQNFGRSMVKRHGVVMDLLGFWGLSLGLGAIEPKTHGSCTVLKLVVLFAVGS